MIVVFDSGIWVSAMEFGGTPLEAVIRAVGHDGFAVCDQIEEASTGKSAGATRVW